jgi:hypothetical protein
VLSRVSFREGWWLVLDGVLRRMVFVAVGLGMLGVVVLAGWVLVELVWTVNVGLLPWLAVFGAGAVVLEGLRRLVVWAGRELDQGR